MFTQHQQLSNWFSTNLRATQPVGIGAAANLCGRPDLQSSSRQGNFSDPSITRTTGYMEVSPKRHN